LTASWINLSLKSFDIPDLFAKYKEKLIGKVFNPVETKVQLFLFY